MVSTQQIGQLSMGLQIGGALTSAVGAYYSADIQRIMLRSQARITEINARLYERAAQVELRKGQRQEQAVRLKGGQLKSRQRVAYAASGVDLRSVSAQAVMTSTDLMTEIDANTAESNAVMSAWGYRTQATNMEIDAMMKRSTAQQISPMLSATTSLLGSAGSVAQSWYNMKKVS